MNLDEMNLDELNDAFIKLSLDAIVEKYDAMLDHNRARNTGTEPRKKYPHIKEYYEKYRSESVDFLSKILFSYDPSKSEKMACCLVLGQIGTDEAKDVLGLVFSKRYGGINYQSVYKNNTTVRGMAGRVLRLLGPPVPDSLIEAIPETHHGDFDRRQMDELLVAIGGSDLDKRLTDFLKRTKSPARNLENRIWQIQVELKMKDEKENNL